jgi:putative transposase
VVDEHGVTRHEFTARRPNELWLADVTEHRAAEGKLYLCAIKDVYSNRIIVYSIGSTMKSQISVNALNNAAARRDDVAGVDLFRVFPTPLGQRSGRGRVLDRVGSFGCGC